MKKLKAIALVAIFATAMFQPMNADAKTKIKHVDAGNNCFHVIQYETALFGLITYGEVNSGTVCLED